MYYSKGKTEPFRNLMWFFDGLRKSKDPRYSSREEVREDIPWSVDGRIEIFEYKSQTDNKYYIFRETQSSSIQQYNPENTFYYVVDDKGKIITDNEKIMKIIHEAIGIRLTDLNAELHFCSRGGDIFTPPPIQYMQFVTDIDKEPHYNLHDDPERWWKWYGIGEQPEDKDTLKYIKEQRHELEIKLEHTIDEINKWRYKSRPHSSVRVVFGPIYGEAVDEVDRLNCTGRERKKKIDEIKNKYKAMYHKEMKELSDLKKMILRNQNAISDESVQIETKLMSVYRYIMDKLKR